MNSDPASKGRSTANSSRPRRNGLSDDVAAYIRELVLTGELKPGNRIDQDAISRDFGVSRSPVREAVVVLGAEGLLELLPRRGAIVANLTRSDVLDHYELYGLISGRAAAFAAEHLGEAELAALAKAHAGFTALDPSESSAANNEFHSIINRSAPGRTRWLIKLLEKSIPSGFYEFADGWAEVATAHHSEILDAIVAGDAELARAAMEGHLARSGEAAAVALENQGFWEDAL